MRAHHAPGQVCWATPEFTVHDTSPSAGSQADGNHGGDKVAHFKKVTPAAAGIPQQHHNHADQPPVEGHTAFPYMENFQGVTQVVAGLIDEGVAQAPPDNHADHTIEDDVFQLTDCEISLALLNAAPAQQPYGSEAQKVH